MKITHTHNRITDGVFPLEELNSIEGVTCTKVLNTTKLAVLKFTQEEYLIEVDMTDSEESHVEIAFELGMLVHSHMTILNTRNHGGY